LGGSLFCGGFLLHVKIFPLIYIGDFFYAEVQNLRCRTLWFLNTGDLGIPSLTPTVIIIDQSLCSLVYFSVNVGQSDIYPPCGHVAGLWSYAEDNFPVVLNRNWKHTHIYFEWI